MSADLKDFRGKISVETDCVLEAMNRVTGKDKSEIAREVLHAWALEKVHVNNVLAQLLRAEGVLAASQGIPGKLRDSEGAAGESKGIVGSRRERAA